MNECVCCGVEIIGDGTSEGDGWYCSCCGLDSSGICRCESEDS